MEIAHPVADEWTEEYSLYAAFTRSVILDEPVTAWLEAAVADGQKPVLLTDVKATLSPFLTAAMRRAGGHWLVRAPSGVFNGLTGYKTERVEDAWAGRRLRRSRLPGYSFERDEVSGRSGALMFDVHAHTRAEADVSVGPLVETMLTGLGGPEPRLWGPAEPLLAAWDPAAMTAAIREQMPVSRVMHAWAPGAIADVDVARTRTGLLHHVKGGVIRGNYRAQRLDQMLTVATRALTALAEEHQPTIAFVSLAETDPGLHTRAMGARPEVPIAVLIGARGVHDLGLSPDALAARHDVTPLGRPRTPSLLVRFGKPDVGLWTQLLAFAQEIGPEKIATTLGKAG